MAKTADRFLEGVKRTAIVPASQPLYDDEDILALADDATESLLVPLLLSVRQDFFVTSYDQTITSGTASYSIPYRASGRALRDLKLYDGTNTKDLTLVPIEDEHLFTSTSTNPHSFYFKGDKIVLVPTPTSTTLTLKIWYNLRPSRLVVLADAAVITAITSTTVTVSSAPSTITTGTVVDFVQSKSGCQTLAMDKTVTNLSASTYTFASGDIPSSLAVGDYLTVAETTPVIQLPDECSNLLETETARKLLLALGDFEGATRLGETMIEDTKYLKMLLEPRITGENTLIINRRGLLRGSRNRYRRGFVNGG